MQNFIKYMVSNTKYMYNINKYAHSSIYLHDYHIISLASLNNISMYLRKGRSHHINYKLNN